MVSPILFCCTILILSSHCRSVVHNITAKSSLVDGQTLVSEGNRFELGFFGQSNSSNMKRYVGIWYTSSPETVVWVANRKNPLSDMTGLLSIFADGNLKLLDKKGKVYWSTELELKGFDLPNLMAKLNDTGNLVLLNGQSGEDFWRSFDKPTDTFLFGMKINTSLALTSWTTGKGPEAGNFTFKQDPVGRNQFVVMEKSITFWKSNNPDSGQVFRSAENEMPATLVNFLNFKNDTENFNDQRLVMNFTGELQYWQWDADTKSWSLIWWVPKDKCGSFNYCGNFGICNAKNRLLPCKCLPGFKPKFSDKWNKEYFSDGCTRNSASSCGNKFLNLKNIKVENTDSSYGATDEAQCRQDCLNNCQCQAYKYVVQRGNNACLTWTEDLKDLQEDEDDGFELYVRVAVSDIESTTRNCETCGTNLVPYPLSTGSKCGDAMYSSFHCNSSTDQLSFITSSGSYDVTSVNPGGRKFVIQIQSKEANNCDSLQSSGSRILQLNQSSLFSVTSWCGSALFNFTSNDSSLNDTIEVEISWKPPQEPTCNSSADCKDWPDSTCNTTGNGQRRCLCNTKFQWDASALNCTRAVPSEDGQVGKASNGNKSIPLIIVLPIAIAMGLLCTVVSIYIWRRKVVKKRTKQRKAALQRYDTERGVKELIDSDKFKEKDGTGIDVPFFDLESILAATDNFSDENKLGKGGFGPVYKGKLPGGEEIAVKRLSSVSGQGLEEFKNEVVLIAKLQHRNLVRLLGYCISGEEKILLYEYMPNRSLDSWIFDESFSHQLDWQTRFNIILGIARGMLYLHQDSRLRIIHRDLKASNVLLDAEMNPKISDFGLARMIQGKQTEANTLRVIGTYGYMAPEYALDGLFSVKSDVFSFGVLMLEMISGKKNTRYYQMEHAPSLIVYAWESWQEGKAMDLMDTSLQSSCNASEFLRCVHVGLLCMHEDPSERPTMSNVVVFLGSETASLPIPKQPALLTRKIISSTALTSSKAAEISTTLQEGR